MAQELSPQHVERIARLARLDPGADKLAVYQQQLSAVLKYVERLEALDLAGVEPLASPMDRSGAMRQDTPGPTLSPADLIAMAPAHFESFVRVPKVLGDGGGA
jgi:aspartyl-tRNA(Asn)/glutamyl-tRNA(Gln) amidotransferase subunit C